MDPEIENFLNFINKKRKRDDDNDNNDINNDNFIKELNYMAIESLENIIDEYKLKGRKLTSFLNLLEDTFEYSKNHFQNLNNKKESNLLISAYSSIIKNIISELKLEIYSNKNLNIKTYLKNKKKENYIPREKRVKFTPLDIKIDFEDKYENNESEYETTDNEENEIPIEILGKSSGETDYSSDSSSEYSENDEEPVNELQLSNKELNKRFISELQKTTSNNSSKDETIKYFCNLESNKKKDLIQEIKNINGYLNNSKPTLFKILSLPLSIDNKKKLLETLTQLTSGMSENSKLRNWLDNILKIPFGIYKGVDFTDVNPTKVKIFLRKLKKEMDNAVQGHNITKTKILQIMGQSIRNPNSKGSIIGIWGPPGNGKTTLIKEGIAKAMNKPFVFISLGGATDASFLEGHSFTYEGSIYGRIARGIIDSKCMDPIIYFDELDKISNTHKGEEIVNLLVHLIDHSQNSKFRDKYFHDLDIDLSKVTFIFSFNNPSRINHILADRITFIETKTITLSQKIGIAKNYLLPNILKDIGIENNNIKISDELLSGIIENYTNEGGVRKLKELLYEICRTVNIKNLTQTKLSNKIVKFPYTLTKNNIQFIFEHYNKCYIDKIHNNASIGIVNGLWANYLGQGGILPIETLLIPSNNIMTIKATGSLQKVIKESIDVALSLAWNNIDENTKGKWLTKWKDKPESFHIHCPDGSVSKDGPSAGAAITLVLYSRLTNKKILNDIAMTGEINLQGNITRIGGLEEKLLGAKKAGVKLVLIPGENTDDFQKILKRHTNLINTDFEVKIVNTFNDVLKYSFKN